MGNRQGTLGHQGAVLAPKSSASSYTEATKTDGPQKPAKSVGRLEQDGGQTRHGPPQFHIEWAANP